MDFIKIKTFVVFFGILHVVTDYRTLKQLDVITCHQCNLFWIPRYYKMPFKQNLHEVEKKSICIFSICGELVLQ